MCSDFFKNTFDLMKGLFIEIFYVEQKEQKLKLC